MVLRIVTTLHSAAAVRHAAAGMQLSAEAARAIGKRRGRAAITMMPNAQPAQARCMSSHARIQLRDIRAWRRAQQAHQTQAKKNGKKGPLVIPRLRKGGMIPLFATEAQDCPAPPSWETLKTVALQRAVPFVGFGFMDNAIMIVAGDYIESSIGLTLGISTMAAAALGVLVADVLGLSVGELIERVALRLGVPEARLTKSQAEMGVTRATAMAGGSVGIAVGCILGMLPLLFIDGKKGDREESPREICTAFTRAATALLHAERVVVYAVERGEGREVKEAFASDGEPTAADTDEAKFLMRQIVLPILEQREAVSFHAYGADGDEQPRPTRGRPPSRSPHNALGWPVFDREGRLIAVAVAMNHYVAEQEGEARARGRQYAAFGAEEERQLVNLCSKLSEALENLYRRPEDHNSFEQNVEATATHAAVPLRVVMGVSGL